MTDLQAPLHFTINGEPQAWQRAGLSRLGQHFTKKQTREWKQAVAWRGAEAMRGRPLFTGPLELLVIFLLPIPATWPHWKRAMAIEGRVVPSRTPDWDNLGKAVSDALNGIAWVDDGQVVDCFTRKRYAPLGCAVVHAKPLDLLPAQVSRRPKA